MEKPLPILIENCVQIAWDYLERSNQISDARFASRFLATLKRWSARVSVAITAYRSARETQKAA
jgi:hypothetical protein